MALQTLIQLLYSTANSSPGTLAVAEPAYSYVSNTFYIGTSGGNGVLKIGGQYYTSAIDNATPAATPSTLVSRDAGGNTNFNNISANTISSNTTIYAGSVYDSGNRVLTSVTHVAGPGISLPSQVTTGPSANVTINNTGVLSLTANSGQVTANATTGNIVFGLATTTVTAGTYGSPTNIPVITFDAYGRATYANTASISTSFNVSGNTGSGVQSGGGTLTIQGGSTGITTTSSGAGGNDTVTINTDSTVLRSNTTGVGPQTIQTDLTVTGNLVVTGTQIYANTSTVQTNDSLIELAANNTTDAIDIGFYGQYGSSGTKYAGLIRKASSNFYLLQGLTTNPTSNTTTFTSANYATLTANITGGTVSGLASAIGVGDGGTGSQSFTTNGVVISGSTGTSALTAATGSAYQVMQLNASGVPVFGSLSGGTF